MPRTKSAARTHGLSASDQSAISDAFHSWRDTAGLCFPWRISTFPDGLEDDNGEADPNATALSIRPYWKGEASIAVHKDGGRFNINACLDGSYNAHECETLETTIAALKDILSGPPVLNDDGDNEGEAIPGEGATLKLAA